MKAKINTKCDFCDDLGFVYATEDPKDPEFGKAVRCPKCGVPRDEYERAEENRRRLEAMDGLATQAERDLRLADFKAPNGPWQKASSAIVEGVGWKRGMVTIIGPTGRGKSTLLICAVNMARVAGNSACYRRTNDLLDDLLAAYRSDDRENAFDRAWRIVADAKVLAIDELAYAGSDWAKDQILSLIDYRWRRRDAYMTVVATPSLRGLPDAVQSRLRADDGEYVELAGNDMRSKEAPYEEVNTSTRKRISPLRGVPQNGNGEKRFWNG